MRPVHRLVLVGAWTATTCLSAFAQPWQEPQNTASALTASDRYAWTLFVALNWPARVDQRAADSSKLLGAPGPVVWETWRNVLSTSSDPVFTPNGADPGPWLKVGAPSAVRRKSDFEPLPRQLQTLFSIQRQLRIGNGLATPAFDASVETGNEVRLNRASYEFIRSARLYNTQGQAAQFAAGKLNLEFPANAKAVKAQWRKITAADKPRYHWAEVLLENGQQELWGLTALHITTKDIPNWLWATFEHIDNKTPGPTVGGPPNIGWQTPSVDRLACPAAPHNCERTPSGLGLEGTKWANYRLRGTQTEFVSTIGEPTVLANSQIEASFQRRSSCITCHARATINRDASQDVGFFPPLVGAPNPSDFSDPITRQREFMQLDFLWSLRRAMPTP